MRVVIATDKFKGTYSSAEVAEFLSQGIRHAQPKALVEIMPMADGGDDTASVLSRFMDLEKFKITAPDLAGEPCEIPIYWQNSRRIAIVESSLLLGVSRAQSASHVFATSSSFGIGKSIQRAIDLRPKEIWIAVGGTMTADLGWGLATALGLKAFDHTGAELIPCFANLGKVVRMEKSPDIDQLSKTPIRVLCDVNCPALGTTISLKSFLDQKGSPPEAKETIDANSESFWRVAQTDLNTTLKLEDAFTGAGGGLLLGLSLVCPQSKAVLGAHVVAKSISLHASLRHCDLVICGEGCLDDLTLYGKAAHVVCELALERQIPVAGVFGRIVDPSKNVVKNLHLWHNIALFDSHLKLPSSVLLKETPHKLIEAGEAIMEYYKRNMTPAASSTK